MRNRVDQQVLRSRIDDCLYVADFSGLQSLQGQLNTQLDGVEAELGRYERETVTGEALGPYLGLVQRHWALCQVLAYLLFRKQQTERELLRRAVDDSIESGSVPSQKRAVYLERLVVEKDVESAARALAVMRHMIGEFTQLQVKVQMGMQTAPLGALYEAEAVMERATDVMVSLENDILYLKKNLDL